MPARSDALVKRLTLIACIMGSGIVLLDGTVVNVALPTIQRALGGGLAAQQWVVNGYLLTLSSLILIGGSLGDLFGERRVFALGVSGFGVASLACALVTDDRRARGDAGAAGRRRRAARAQLAGGDRQHLPGGKGSKSERGAAIGSWTAWGAIAGVLGPLAGGELLAIGSWRWLFLINVPLALGCVWLILFAVPRAAPREAGARGSRRARRAAVRRRSRRPGVRADRAAPPGLVESRGVRPVARRVVAARCILLWHESRARDPMLPLGPVQTAQLLRRATSRPSRCMRVWRSCSSS